MIHPLADVKSTQIGENTRVWQFAVILEKAVIGDHCNINCHTFIENDVLIGNYVTIKSGVFIWDGIRIENHVFIGPNATFVNNNFPRSQQYPEKHIGCTIRKGASIGANATILSEIILGEYCLIGAGAVVTKDVPAYALIVGNPGKQIGWVDEQGQKMTKNEDGKWVSSDHQLYKETIEGLALL